ncbi:hypothetical protein N8H74_15925 [Pseudomonas sp. B2M1-30]|uniref:hypothetical protein n=1 Tax=Pseudomonas TaxID=286 RepID=UPI0021C9491B|nr:MULTISPECIES: hypothetical protein [Pseudomonas]MCU0119754.1 hypothetical protein [Pseudomonas sp. B2M1-30]MCU7261750.1 hypothetical protein [Pseudomonas koreensis]
MKAVDWHGAFASKPAPTGFCTFFEQRTHRKEISTPARQKCHRKHLGHEPNSPSTNLLAANVADVAAIVVIRDPAQKSVERAGIFNTSKLSGNIWPSSLSATKSDVRDARQKSAKTRHF